LCATLTHFVERLSGNNLAFTAVLAELPLPYRGDGMPGHELAGGDTDAGLLVAFGQPGVLDRSSKGPSPARMGE
jgi:hypothetical protein